MVDLNNASINGKVTVIHLLKFRGVGRYFEIGGQNRKAFLLAAKSGWAKFTLHQTSSRKEMGNCLPKSHAPEIDGFPGTHANGAPEIDGFP